MPIDPTVLLFASLAFLLLVRVPIGFALLLSSAITIAFLGIPLSIVIQRLYAGLNGFPLLAVPLFLIAGAFMNFGGVTDRLLHAASALVGRVPGALAHINVVSSMFFGGVSGSSLADTAAVGGIMIPGMIRKGYPPAFAAALTAASSTMGILIPPSVDMVIYGALANVSVGALFLGGLVPGILVGVSQMLLILVLNRRHNFPVGTAFTWKQRWEALVGATPTLILPIIIVGGIVGGVFTAIEAGAVAAVYAALLVLVFYRTVSWKGFVALSQQAIQQVGSVLFTVSAAVLFGWVLAYQQVPLAVEQWAVRQELGTVEVMLFIVAMFAVLGTVMGGMASIIAFLPVVMALTSVTDLHPVHLGVVIIMTIGLGLLTPPLGLCLLLAAKIANISVLEAFRGAFIFVLMFVIVMLIVALVPELVLFLPNLLTPEFM